MATNACAASLSLNAEITMLQRLPHAFATCGRALVDLRQRLFPRTRASKPAAVARNGTVSLAERAEEDPIAPAIEQENLDRPAFIQTQSQLLEVMLHSMILACGDESDDSARRNGAKAKR